MKTELERAREHMAKPLAPGAKREPFTFSAYKADAVKLRLEELFHSKCAYCESFYGSQAPVDVEHYRPKGAVDGEADHPGYWWVAMEWTNLLPSCIDCNRRRKQQAPQISGQLNVLYLAMQTGKKDSFPIAGTRAFDESADLAVEQPLLLNPTRDDPEEHLVFWLGDEHGAGLVYPKPREDGGLQPFLPAIGQNAQTVAAAAAAEGVSVRGAVSIQIFGLNRVRLVQERARLVRQLRFMESLVLEIGEVVDVLEQYNLQAQSPEVTAASDRLRTLVTRVLNEMRGLAAPDSPYSSVAAAYLRDFRKRLGEH